PEPVTGCRARPGMGVKLNFICEIWTDSKSRLRPASAKRVFSVGDTCATRRICRGLPPIPGRCCADRTRGRMAAPPNPVAANGRTRLVMRLTPPELAHSALEAAPDAMLIVDAEGTICFANRQVFALFGYAREELLGLPVETLTSPTVPQSAFGAPRRLHDAHAGTS
ncbi:PAS fold domain protein, partial [mine drainage metagenome]